MSKYNISPLLVKDTTLYLVGRFFALFTSALLVRFFFFRKGFINYSNAWAALNLDKKGGGILPLELLSTIFKWFKPNYSDLTIPANLLAILLGTLAILFWVGATRFERSELAFSCGMAFSCLPLPIITSTSWTSEVLTGLFLGMSLFCFIGAREKGAWLYFFFFGIFLGISLAMDFPVTLLLFPFFAFVITTKKEMVGKLLLFSLPLLLLSLVLTYPANLSQNIFVNLKTGYVGFLLHTGDLLVDNFSISLLVGYLCAVGYLFIAKEKMVVFCSLIATLPYILVPIDSQARLLFAFIVVIITLNYGVLRFVENSPGYSFEQYIMISGFLTFICFATTPAKTIMFSQFGDDRNEDIALTRQVREVVGNGRLLADEYFDCFSFYSHSRPFDIIRMTRDKTEIQGFGQVLAEWKLERKLAMTSGVRNIFHKSSIYPKDDIILRHERTNIYEVRDFF
jgi:hypothetical protein